MTHEVPYRDLGPDHYLSLIRNPHQRAQRLIHQLRAMGYPITLPDIA